MTTSARTGEDSNQATTWGNSLTRNFSRRLKPVISRVGQQDWERDADLEVDGGIRHGTGRWTTLLLAYQCIGVVYGDIGTSPLYTFAGIFSDPKLEPTPENFIGAASLIIWTIISLPLIKYAIIVLRADDNGQGGSLALFSQLRRQGLLTTHAAERRRSASAASSRRSLSEASVEGVKVPPQDWRQRFISQPMTQKVLEVMVVVGVGLLLGDGVLTPAVTIVSAAEGLEVATSGVGRNAIVGISCALIAGLFLVQSFGPSKLGFMFSPVMLVYFAFNAGVGVYNIFKYTNGAIFKAFSPHYWFMFFLRNGHTGWRVLSGVLLCATGTEAMFADIGHFNRNAIRTGFIFVAFPSLVCMYLGQASYLIKNPEGVSTAFFASLPGGKALFWPMFVTITAASIVASQALISASFAIASQAITQGFFPRFRVTHTSKTHTGQIYIAVINYTLMALTLIITVAFKTSARLSTAYGLAVFMDMSLTSIFMVLIIVCVWRKPALYALVFFVIFAAIEWTFLTSSLLKVPAGAWFTLMMAGIYAFIMSVWSWGSTRKARYFKQSQQSLGQFLKGRVAAAASANGAAAPPPADEGTRLLSQLEVPAQQQLPGVGLFYSESLHGVPHVLTEVSRMFSSLPQVCIFLTNRAVPLPEVLPAERLLVQQLGAPGFYHVIARYGYAQQIEQGERFVKGVLRHMQALLYKALCHRLAVNDALASLAQRRKLSRGVARIVNAAVGDIYGEGHPSPELTADRTANAHLSESTYGLTQSSGDAPSRMRRPTILDNPMFAAGPGNGAEGEDSSASAAADISAAAALAADGSVGTAKRAAAEAAAAGVGGGAFEAEMLDWAKEMEVELESAFAKGVAAADAEPLQRLAAELSLVAAAARAGVLGYVIGRSHAMLEKGRGIKALPKNLLLEVPFQFLSKNTEQDMHVAYSVPVEKLLEVGLIYKL